MLNDPYHLERFGHAQQGIYEQAVAELREGRKHSHWMWFIFPQIAGLGSSPMAVRYAIASLDEARAYLAHPFLGARLRQVTNIVLELEGRTASQIFGYPDDLKFHSSMTLFAHAAEDERTFKDALGRYFAAKLDPGTMARL